MSNSAKQPKMQLTDLNGKVIKVDNLTLALLQADDYRHYKHTNSGFEKSDAELQAYWEDVYQKLLKLTKAGG